MPDFLKPRYRIVTDCYLGYQVEYWRWWWPFWVMPGVNTFRTLEGAENYIRYHSKQVVKYIGVPQTGDNHEATFRP